MPKPDSSIESGETGSNNTSLEKAASSKSFNDTFTPMSTGGDDSTSGSTSSTLKKGDAFDLPGVTDKDSNLNFGNPADLYGDNNIISPEPNNLSTPVDNAADPFNLKEFQIVDNKPQNSLAKSGELSQKEGESENIEDNSKEKNSESSKAKELSEADIKKRIDDLDSDDFNTRERARKDLVDAGAQENVRKGLKDAVDNPTSPEQQLQARRALNEIKEQGKGDAPKEGSSKEKPNLSQEEIKKLTKDLDSDSFQTREEATRALQRAGNADDVMKHMAETIENPASPEQRKRAEMVASGLGKNATPEQLQSMHKTMKTDKNLTDQQKNLYKDAINSGLRNADGPVEFKDDKGRVTGVYDGSLDNKILEAEYNDQGQLKEATIRGTTFTRNEDGTYNRSDGFTVENAEITKEGNLRFNFEGRPPMEWRQNGDNAYFDKKGNWTSTTTRDGRTITPRGEIDNFRPGLEILPRNR